MKSATWHQNHLTAGDAALDAAGKLLDSRYYTDNALARANALIALARAHYRACEVDARLKETQ